jgi:hypothetical protein
MDYYSYLAFINIFLSIILVSWFTLILNPFVGLLKTRLDIHHQHEKLLVTSRETRKRKAES